jgi:GT2 family glycosyltransferase
MIDVICVTSGNRDPKGLHYIPDEYRYLSSNAPGWGVTANALLDASKNDVLFIDDDIELTSESLRSLQFQRWRFAIMGFTLFAPNPDGSKFIQSAGHILVPHGDDVQLVPQPSIERLFRPCYLAHVTASCMYIPREVIATGIRFPEWDDGTHYEDVAFTLDCWLHGFSVMYYPGFVLHHIDTQKGAGSEKAQDADFNRKRALNESRLKEWMRKKCVADACIDGQIPLGSRLLEDFNGEAK